MTGGTPASRSPARWLPPAVAAVAAAGAFAALAAHAWQALGGAYLSYVSGIWLALGRDLVSGVFYRDLIGPLGYGGTRYFPLFFVVIGSLLKIGLPPLAAGWTASAIAATILATGLARLGRVLGAPRSMRWLLAACAVAPYFVQQTLFEVRADVLAAALNVWGLSAVAVFWTDRSGARPRVAAAAIWFTLAFAAKVTSLAVPACVFAALVGSGRGRVAVRFAMALAIGVAAFFAIVEVASAGRALESWRACMFAGSTQGGTVSELLTGQFAKIAGYSHLLIALFVLDAAAIGLALFGAGSRSVAFEAESAASAAGDRRVPWLPAALFLGVSASTALTLSSPGTVPSNQVVEWLETSFVVLIWIAATRPTLRRPLAAAIAVVVIWMGGQDAIRARALWETRAARTSLETRSHVVEIVASPATPSLAESSLWQVLAGHQAYLLDPFALRVVMMSRSDIARDLEAKIDAHYFSTVIFQVDPTSAQGRGYYEHVNFGWPITERILEDTGSTASRQRMSGSTCRNRRPPLLRLQRLRGIDVRVGHDALPHLHGGGVGDAERFQPARRQGVVSASAAAAFGPG